MQVADKNIKLEIVHVNTQWKASVIQFKFRWCKDNKKKPGVIIWNGVGFFTLVVDFIDLPSLFSPPFALMTQLN